MKINVGEIDRELRIFSRWAFFACAFGGLGICLLFREIPEGLHFAARIVLWAVAAYSVVYLFFKAWRLLAKEPRKAVFSAIALLFVLFCTEIFCQVAHRVLLKVNRDYALSVSPLFLDLTQEQREILQKWVSQSKNYLKHSSTLGWDLIPLGSSKKGLYTTNSIGTRGPDENEIERTPGVHRVICCGDSFTYCADVQDQDSWPYMASQLRDDWEFFNLGVSAYGLTQSYVRYKERGAELQPDIVLIGFMTENIRRSINAFRPFVNPKTNVPLTKPYCAMEEGGRLRIYPPEISDIEGYQYLLENTKEEMIRLASADYYGSDILDRKSLRLAMANVLRFVEDQHGPYRRIYLAFFGKLPRSCPRIQRNDYGPEEPPLLAVAQLFRRFAEEVKKNESRPVAVVFPRRSDLREWKKNGFRRHQTLIDKLKEMQIEYIDLTDWIVEQYHGDSSYKALFTGNGHYSPEVNGFLARRILEYLSKNRGGQTAEEVIRRGGE